MEEDGYGRETFDGYHDSPERLCGGFPGCDDQGSAEDHEREFREALAGKVQASGDSGQGCGGEYRGKTTPGRYLERYHTGLQGHRRGTPLPHDADGDGRYDELHLGQDL